MFERYADASCHRARAVDQIERKVFHRRIEHFLDVAVEPVYLVDEKHVALFKPREYGGKIHRLFDCRPACHLYLRSEFACDNVCESGFAKPRRTVKQNVIESVVSALCRRYEHAKIFLYLLLPDVLVHSVRAQTVVLLVVFYGERIHHSVCDVKALIFFCEL